MTSTSLDINIVHRFLVIRELWGRQLSTRLDFSLHPGSPLRRRACTWLLLLPTGLPTTRRQGISGLNVFQRANDLIGNSESIVSMKTCTTTSLSMPSPTPTCQGCVPCAWVPTRVPTYLSILGHLLPLYALGDRVGYEINRMSTNWQV